VSHPIASVQRVDPDSTTTDSTKDRYHHGDLERALLTEALSQVRHLGGESVSLRAVAQAVGVSPSAAYSHFPDKTALMTAVAVEGMHDLDARMVAAVESHPGTDDAAAIQRFRATGVAYAAFALEEPHLFRHMFGPFCPDLGSESGVTDQSMAYQVLCAGLDDLERRGLLRPGTREGLDLVAWTSMHGFAFLVLDGFLPQAAGQVLIDALGRMALADHARDLIEFGQG
jgi:AcrR family transcriptional regulator